MKKIIAVLILLAILLAGCTPKVNAQIAATTLPVYEFTNALCEGTGISVSRLITESVSCLHDYSLQVSQVQSIENARIVVINGGGLEEFMEDMLSSADAVIDASAEIDLTCGHQHGEHTHTHDPHIWLSPKNAKQMCKTICSELSETYPAYQEQFEVNLATVLAKLDALQTYGEQELADLACRDLITFHDGFAYFANSFGLHILKAVEEESGSEASAKELTELTELVNDHSLPAIFTELNGSTAAAEIIARETGVKIYTLDMAMAGDSYFEAMYHNIDTVKEALG